MASKQLNNVANISPQSGKRRQNVVLAVGVGLLALATWQTGKSGACFGGACMIPDFARMDRSAREKAAGLDNVGGADGGVTTAVAPNDPRSRGFDVEGARTGGGE
jgi:hypothetical protein